MLVAGDTIPNQGKSLPSRILQSLGGKGLGNELAIIMRHNHSVLLDAIVGGRRG